ncbi:MAG: molecular chaperone HtpG [Bacteroidales bacterium]|nr:molecular chaperone HtpG [Bacteroidales bacterium]
MTKKGRIGVTTDNIFPIIKKFLYSDHEIFLRELVSNAVDATQKLKTISSVGDFKGELGDISVRVSIDEEAGTLTISDKGIGMTAEEIDMYINEIALSSANDFLDKYKDNSNAIIGHFGLGFYSAFMVAKKVEIKTLSYKDDAEAVKWSCDGSPEYTIEKIEKETRGTDIVLHIDDENKEFLQKDKITTLLNKYCKFLPIPIVFGKKQEWKDGKSVETDEDNVINNTTPAWTRRPNELKDEDYLNFYRELYPMGDEPLFWIHLNVDYPFNLTGILYFPLIKSNIDLQRNKIRLYSYQVIVTDSVEGNVTEFLTLLHGVIDSPDIPLNVSRSYLQSDHNVKKISNHISKKVADRLEEIYKQDRNEFEDKWESLKLFIEYGMLTDERFYERAENFTLVKNIDGKHFTLDEYKTLIEENQTDKDGNITYLYASNKDDQFAFIDGAKEKGYDVLLMDGQLDTHWVGLLEQKLEKSRFIRVDSDTAENIIVKEEPIKVDLTDKQKENIEEVVKSQLPKIEKTEFMVDYKALGKEGRPIQIIQNEFSRRMKEMSQMQQGMAFYGEMPDTYQVALNVDHPIIAEMISVTESKEKEELQQYAVENNTLHQLIDLALLANGMLKGKALNEFIKRNYEGLANPE